QQRKLNNTIRAPPAIVILGPVTPHPSPPLHSPPLAPVRIPPVETSREHGPAWLRPILPYRHRRRTSLSCPKSSSTTPQPHPSLPARPPPPAQPPAFSKFGPGPNSSSKSQQSAFTAFKPRAVASNPQSWQSQSPTVAAGPQPPSAYPGAQSSYTGAGHRSNAYQPQAPYYPQPSVDPYHQPTPPQIRNPFPAPGQASSGGYGAANASYDPEYEAQIAQWQSAYVNRDDGSSKGPRAATLGATNANATPL
ncbi:hypothetical protein BC567DRAFT_195805, partial [Phyllosticta citribraziliensis]